MTIASPPFAIYVDRSGPSGVIVYVVGELDVGSCREFSDCLLELAGEDIVVDLANLTFVDSTGLNAIVGAYKRTTVAGQSLVLRAPTLRVAKVLEVTGLDQVFTIEP